MADAAAEPEFSLMVVVVVPRREVVLASDEVEVVQHLGKIIVPVLLGVLMPRELRHQNSNHPASAKCGDDSALPVSAMHGRAQAEEFYVGNQKFCIRLILAVQT